MLHKFDDRLPDPVDESHLSLYALCILLILMALFFSSDVFHVQLLQYITPDGLAPFFARLGGFSMRLIGTCIYIVICSVLLFFLPHDTKTSHTQ